MKFLSDTKENKLQHIKNKNYFKEDMNFYICSSGGCGSTILFNYLSNFGNVYHIHDRYPPKKLKYIGKDQTDKDIYSEWFNDIDIPEDKLKNYKVIFIYRNPIEVIFSRFTQQTRPNKTHLNNIKCINNGNINFLDVINTKLDLYGMENFFDNYIIPTDRNYNIYAVKYELFWNNINVFNEIMDIPDIKQLYPIKQERKKPFSYVKELNYIYNSLINKMNKMKFIEIILPVKQQDDMVSVD